MSLFPYLTAELAKQNKELSKNNKKSKAYYRTRARSLMGDNKQKQVSAFSQVMSSKDQPGYE